MLEVSTHLTWTTIEPLLASQKLSPVQQPVFKVLKLLSAKYN